MLVSWLDCFLFLFPGKNDTIECCHALLIQILLTSVAVSMTHFYTFLFNLTFFSNENKGCYQLSKVKWLIFAHLFVTCSFVNLLKQASHIYFQIFLHLYSNVLKSFNKDQKSTGLIFHHCGRPPAPSWLLFFHHSVIYFYLVWHLFW